MANGNNVFYGPEGPITVYNVTISNDEYADLIEAKTTLDLILAVSKDDGYGACDVIKAAKKTRGMVTTSQEGTSDA